MFPGQLSERPRFSNGPVPLPFLSVGVRLFIVPPFFPASFDIEAHTDNCYAMHFPDSLYFTGIIVLFVVLLSWKNSHCCIDFSREVMYNASSGLLRESRTNRK